MVEPHLKIIRQAEFQFLAPYLPSHAINILEVGAGPGWQSYMLAKHGLKVQAIDTSLSSIYTPEFSVQIYDGRKIPFANATFDWLFSSNVIDHVSQLDDFSKEMHRVLKPGGSWLLVVPTTAWRWWTLLTFYISLPLILWRRFFRRTTKTAGAPIVTSQKKRFSLLPHRLGERGNSLSELVLFSKRSREQELSRLGWVVRQKIPMPIFYTGVSFLGYKLPMRLRKALALVLGSGSFGYVLQRRNENV